MVQVQPYNLPDEALMDSLADEADYLVWRPEKTVLVLGQSNELEKSVHTSLAEADQVEVMKRPSGGESVILSPQTLVISVRLISDKLENPSVYFKQINGSIMDSLHSLGVQKLAYRGISDIAVEHKKILGSSIYRKKRMVFYHAVLNISEDTALISKYLKHPGKEPDYRQGRSHKEFVTSLHEAGYHLDHSTVSDALIAGFQKDL